MRNDYLTYFREFSSILEAMPDALIIVDESGHIVFASQQVIQLFGYSSEELVGNLVEFLMPQRFREKHPQDRKSYFANPTVRSMGSQLELFGLKKDGSEFPIEISLSPLKTENGLFALAAMRDITIRKKNEEAIVMLSDIVYSFDDAIICKDLNGTIISWNTGAERLYGFTSDEAIGKSISIIIPSDRMNEFKHISSKIIQGESVKYTETNRIRKDGEPLSVSITVSPVKDAKGNIVGASTIARDISRQKKLEDALRTKNIELEQAILAKDNFLASMSHELRTPLNAIIGFTGTLLMRLPGPLTGEQEKQLNTVKGSAKHLLSLINDLLDLAKINSGKVEIHFEEVICQNVITEIVNTISTLAEAKDIRLEVRMPEEKIIVNSDLRVLTQILINLTNNAIKYTEKGSVIINLSKKQMNNEECVVIDVIDTGVGIKSEDLDKLFMPFQKLEGSGKYIEGTGLGLHLCRKLAMLVNTRIEFESEFSKGSRFSIIIPTKNTANNIKVSYETHHSGN